MRVVITAGGTGGHIFPALAIYHQLKKNEPNLEVLYIGTKDRMESTLIPEQNIPYKGIEMKGLNRKNLFANFKVLSIFRKAIQTAKEELIKFQPDIVIGVGGYITAPVIYASHKLGIPCVIHEQNSIAGLSNRFLSRYVDKIFVSFEENVKDFPKDKTIYTGNPRSEEVTHEKKASKAAYGLSVSRKLVIIVMGSLGSMTVNERLKEMISSFQDKDYEVLLVTGKEYYHDYQNLSIPKNVKVTPFVNEFLGILKCADLIVSRAGASSISEITALALPSILVPSPYVTHNHQMKNALALKEKGACEILKEEDFSGENLLPMIDSILNQPKKYQEMKRKAKEMGVTDSATQIYKEIKKIVKENAK